MLVHDHGVEAEPIGQHELGDVTIVEFVTLLRIVELVREIHPKRIVFRLVRRQTGA